MQLAIFLDGEFVAARSLEFGFCVLSFEFWPAIKTVTGKHKPLGDGKVHHSVGRAHFELNCRVADMLAEPTLFIFASPCRGKTRPSRRDAAASGGHLQKWTIYHGHIMLHAKADVGILIERPVAN